MLYPEKDMLFASYTKQQTNKYLGIFTFKYVVLLAYENLLSAILVNI